MNPSWMELVLDSIKNHQVQMKQLFEQQKALQRLQIEALQHFRHLSDCNHSQALNGIVSTEPGAKRRKDSRQGYGVDDKENVFSSGTAHHRQSNSTRIHSSIRQMKKLMDSSNLERNLDPCQLTYFKETDEGKLGNKLISADQEFLDHRKFGAIGQSEEAKVNVLHETTLEKTKSSPPPPKLNTVRGRKCGGAVKGETVSVASDATEYLGVLPGAERLKKKSDPSEMPCPVGAPVPLRMTRARAKALKDGEGHSLGAQEPAKKPRAHKGKAKALPQATSGRGVEESANIVSNLQVAHEKSSRTELVLDDNDALPREADELRDESMMNQMNNIDAAALSEGEQHVKRQNSKPKAFLQIVPATSEEENEIPAIVNLHFAGTMHLGCEVSEVYAEVQSGGEDVPPKEHTKIPDDSTSNIAQKEQEQVKIYGQTEDIGRAASQTITSVCEEGNVLQGVAYTPLAVVTDLRIERTQEDKEVVWYGMVADDAVFDAPCTEAEDDRAVTSQVFGRRYRDKSQVAKNNSTWESEKGAGHATLQESQPALETNAELKTTRRARRRKGSLDAVSNRTVSKIGDVNDDLGDALPAEQQNATIQSVEAHEDRYSKGIEDASFEAKRENENDLSSADLDSERWEDLKRSVKVRKGRGKAVSNFLGYADSDLFPVRTLALEHDSFSDLVPEQGMKDVENAGSPKEGKKGGVETAQPSSCLLEKMEDGGFDSTQRNLQTNLDLGGRRTDDGEDGRQSGASQREKTVARQCTDSEEFSGEGMKGKVSTDGTRGPSGTSGKRRVVGISATGADLTEGDDIGGGRSVVTRAISQGPGPDSESLQRSGGAVVSGKGFQHLVKEFKLDLVRTEPKESNMETIIGLSPGERFGIGQMVVPKNPRPVSGYNRGRSHDACQNHIQNEQVEASRSKSQSTLRTVDFTGGPKLVPEGDLTVCSCEKQGLEMFANVKKGSVEVVPTLPESLESNVVLDVEKLPFVSVEQVRRVSGYQGGAASPIQDSSMKLRPFPEYCDTKPSTDKKFRTYLKSLEGGDWELEEEQATSPLEGGEHLALDSVKARRSPTAENTSPVDRIPTRGNVCPLEGEPSNRKRAVSCHLKSDKSRAQMAVDSEASLFKEVFKLKTPFRSQRRNVIEVSSDCQLIGQEGSPPFHVLDAKRSCRGSSKNHRLSQSNELENPIRVGDDEIGGSGLQTCATVRSPPEEPSARVGLSGGCVRYESTELSPIPKRTGNAAKTYLPYNFSSPAREVGRSGKITPDSSQKSGKSGSQPRGANGTCLLGHDNRPLNVIQVPVSPPLQISQENWSGDTMVISEDDYQDTSASTLKSLDLRGQGQKLDLPTFSLFEPEKLSQLQPMTVASQDLNPRKVSLRSGVYTAESDLAVKAIGNSSSSKFSQHLNQGSARNGGEVKGDRNTVPGHYSVRNTCVSGGFEERLERSKRTLHSPLPPEPKRSRLSSAGGSGGRCGRTLLDSGSDPKVIFSRTVDEVTTGESLQQAGAVHSGSTGYVSVGDEGFGAESSGNRSIESRRMSKLESVEGDVYQDHALEVRQRHETEDFSGDDEFADEANALEEGARVTDVEECSGDDEIGTEEVVGSRNSSKERLNSCSWKSSSRKRKEQESPQESCGFHRLDEYRNAAEAYNLSCRPSHQGGGAYSVDGKECSENSTERRIRPRRTIELQETSSCHVGGYAHELVLGDPQFKSDCGDCEIADDKTPIYGKACAGGTSTSKAARSSERSRTNSNILNSSAQSTRLLSSVRTLIPVIQRPTPNFIPNGKRDVKVKALEAAEAARRLQERREMEKRERMQKRAEANARRALEKEKPKEEMHKAEQESKAAQKAVSDSTTAKDLSAPTARAALTDYTNSKSLQSPKSKSTRAHAVKAKMEQEKTKRLEQELKRKEEERKQKEAEILARKRMKEEGEKKDREEKRRRQEEMLKQRREQEERLRAELEEKEHRRRLLEEAERERKVQEEEARRQRRAERERERERRQKEELEAKAARQAEKEAERKRKEVVFLLSKASEEHDHKVAESMGAAIIAPRILGQHSTGLSTDRLQASNLLSTGASLSFGKPARVPSTAFEGRTQMIGTPMVQKKGPTSSLPTIKSLSLATGPSTAGKNSEMESGRKTFATPTLAALEYHDTGPQSYEISPYRSSSDDEDEDKTRRPKKFIPAWASKENLEPQLMRQLRQDPDEIFAGTKTCSLKEVFGTNGSKKIIDFGRRSGSGDWVKDRVSWKEELLYKIHMGYIGPVLGVNRSSFEDQPAIISKSRVNKNRGN